MHLAVLSLKPCWEDPASPTGLATDGGFPYQMAALAELFDRTTVIVPRRPGPAPPGLRALTGTGLDVRTFPEPPGQDLRRKLSLLLRLPWLLPKLWRWVGEADAVHAVVPGDIGVLGIPLALLRRRRLFVRHCGTWPIHGSKTIQATATDRVLHRLLLSLARRSWKPGRAPVILATGGGENDPVPSRAGRAGVSWIFSTTLRSAELERPEKPFWRPEAGEPLRLITAGRLTRGKNAAAVVRAVQKLRNENVDVVLDILGHGPERQALETLAKTNNDDGAISFHGNKSHQEVLEHLDRAHVMVFPTRVTEGFPKAVLEAMACGTLVLAPRVSVLPLLLAESGVLLDGTDPETVATALRRVVEGPGTAAALAANGRQTARRYTLEAWRDAIGERLTGAWGTLREDGR